MLTSKRRFLQILDTRTITVQAMISTTSSWKMGRFVGAVSALCFNSKWMTRGIEGLEFRPFQVSQSSTTCMYSHMGLPRPETSALHSSHAAQDAGYPSLPHPTPAGISSHKFKKSQIRSLTCSCNSGTGTWHQREPQAGLQTYTS